MPATLRATVERESSPINRVKVGPFMALGNDVTITLSQDEALVLFDFLQREIDAVNGSRLVPATEHEGELWALNGLNCLLERELAAPFKHDYDQILQQSRASLIQRNGSWPD